MNDFEKGKFGFEAPRDPSNWDWRDFVPEGWSLEETEHEERVITTFRRPMPVGHQPGEVTKRVKSFVKKMNSGFEVGMQPQEVQESNALPGWDLALHTNKPIDDISMIVVSAVDALIYIRH